MDIGMPEYFCVAPDAGATSRFAPYLNAQGVPFRWPFPKQVLLGIKGAAPTMLATALVRAIGLWKAACPTINIVKPLTGTVQIEVQWDTKGCFIPDRTLLAYTSLTLNGIVIQGAHIIINARDYAWHCGTPRGYTPRKNTTSMVDLEAVALHELGHAMGLDHSKAGALPNVPCMWAQIAPGEEQLHPDDIAGIRSLYN